MRSGRFLLAVTLACATACQNNKFGDAIGRPFPGALPGSNTAGIDIASVSPDAAPPLVVIAFDQNVGATLSDYHLENTARTQVSVAGAPIVACAPPADGFVCYAIAMQAQLGAPSTPPTPVSIGLQSGEVALVGSDGTVETYFAWGEDPSVRGSSLYFAALSAGLPTTPVVVPFPLSAGAVIGPSGCNNCTTLPSPLQLSEVHPSNGAIGSSYVELSNVSSGDVDASGVRVCTNGACQALVAGTVIAAGTVLQVSIGVDIPGDVETVLAAPGTGAPQLMLDYMRTLLAPTTFETAAISLGIWSDAASPIGDYVPGESLSRNPGTADWFPALASPGVANPSIARTGTWSSCAEPALPLVRPAPASVLVSVIDRRAQMVTLANTTALPVDLSQVQLAVSGAGVATTGSLAPGASLALAAAVDDTGTIDLSIAGSSAQFAQWGNPAAGVSTAVIANLWPSTSCLLPRIDTQGVLSLRDPTLARGSGAYAP